MSAQEGRLYEPIVWSLGSFLFFASICMTILMWTNVIGPFRFLDLSEEERSRTVGLWLPGAPARAVPADTTIRLNAWRRMLPEGASVMASHSLDSLVQEGVGIVAVPDGRGISPADVDALSRFLIRGGGAILTGSIGVRGDDGEWRGYDLMRRLLRVRWVRPVPTELSTAVSAWHRGPVSSALEPAEEIELILEPGAPTLSASDGELRWGSSPAKEWLAASHRRAVGRGRLLWLAAGPESAKDSGDEEFRPMVRLIRTAVAWVSRRPVVEILPWPNGATFAAQITPPQSEDEESLPAQSFAEAARSGGMTVLVASPEAETRNASAAKALREKGGWVANRSSVNQWLAVRDGLRTHHRLSGERRLRIDVSNLAELPARAVVLRIHVNRPLRRAGIEGTTVGQENARLRLQRPIEALDVALPELPAHASRSYTIDLEWPEPAS